MRTAERVCKFILVVALLSLPSFALAAPPIDEDALPEGAIARLGTRERYYFLPEAHTFVDGGHVIVMVTMDSQVFYRDVATGKLLQVKAPPFHDAMVSGLSANARTLVIQNAKSVIAWDLNSEKKALEIPIKTSDRCPCDISADGNRLVLVRENSLECWDIRTGRSKTIASSDQPIKLHSLVLGDSAVLVTISNQLRCLTLESGQIRWTLDFSTGSECRVLPGGRFGLLEFSSNDKHELFDLDAGKPTDLHVHKDLLLSYRWGPESDGEKVFQRTPSGGIRVRELVSGKTVAEFPGAEPLDLTPDGKYLIGCDGRVQFQCWSLETGKPLNRESATDRQYGYVVGLAFRPDGKSILSQGGEDYRFLKWEIASRQSQSLLATPDSNDECSLTQTPNGSHALRLHKSGQWEMFDVERNVTKTGKIDFAVKEGDNVPHVQTDGKTLFVSSTVSDERTEDGIARDLFFKFDLATGKSIWSRNEPSSQEGYLVSSDASLYVRHSSGIKEIGSGRLVMPFKLTYHMDSWSASFVSNVNRFATDQETGFANDSVGGSQDGIYLYEISTGLPVILPIVGTPLCFSRNGRVLAIASHESIHILDAMTGQELRRYKVHRPGHPILSDCVCAYCGTVSADGTILATGHQDGTILLWNLPSAPRQRPFNSRDYDQLWSDLAAKDAGKAWTAMARFMDSPAESLKLLGQRLKPTLPIPSDKVNGLIDDLMSPQYAKREAATYQLSTMIDLIENRLNDELSKSTSPEKKQRLSKILQAPLMLHDLERIRLWRATIVLEQIGTPDARNLLEIVAQSPPGCIETKAANAAIDRLAVRR
jgi:WD40 repeat protein